MLNSAFRNANTYSSEIFYFNISESQTYSKYYHCQGNISNLSPWYIPPSASVQMCKPILRSLIDGVCGIIGVARKNIKN